MLAAAGASEGCVGDSPTVLPPSTTSPEASAACTGTGCLDGAPTSDAGGTTDAGTDGGPPRCSTIAVTTLAGSDAEGNTDGTAEVARFSSPEGITVDTATGTLFVADTGNALVRKVTRDGTTTTYSPTPDAGNNWLQPRHAAYPSDYDTLFVSDRDHDQVFNVSGSSSTAEFGIANLRAFTTQPVKFKKFVVSSTRVARYDSGFEATTFSGTTTPGFADGPASGALYGNLVDLAFDGEEDLYVADQANHRIRKVVATEGVTYGDVATIAGNATAGHVDGQGAAAQFEGPHAFVFDPVKRIFYIADGATIRVMTTAGEVTTLVGSTSAFAEGDGCTAKFINAIGITRFANELFVLDVNRIRKITLPP